MKKRLVIPSMFLLILPLIGDLRPCCCVSKFITSAFSSEQNDHSCCSGGKKICQARSGANVITPNEDGCNCRIEQSHKDVFFVTLSSAPSQDVSALMAECAEAMPTLEYSRLVGSIWLYPPMSPPYPIFLKNHTLLL